MTMSESGWTLIDQELGVWQLLEREGVLHLQVRYSVGSAIDTAVLFPLDDDERAALDEGGYDYLAALARQVQSSGYPVGDESSPFHERDLYGGSAQTPERERLWDEVWAAIEGRQLHRAAGFRYPRSFELARRQAIGDPPYLDVDEARAAHAAGQALTVISSEDGSNGTPQWYLRVSAKGFRFTLTFYSDLGTSIRQVSWERDGDDVRRVRTVDLFHPDGDPGRDVAWIDVPYVDRVYAANGTVTVTWSPPGRISGETEESRQRNRELPSFAAGPTHGENGPVHTVRGVPAVRQPVPAFDAWQPLVDASAPEELERFGPGALTAAKAYSAARP